MRVMHRLLIAVGIFTRPLEHVISSSIMHPNEHREEKLIGI
jgi:hypothetical protein